MAANPKKNPKLVADGHRLAGLRDAAGLTQEELAKESGIHKITISKWESGMQRITYPNAQKLAPALSCTPEEIMGVMPIGYRDGVRRTVARMRRELDRIEADLSAADKDAGSGAAAGSTALGKGREQKRRNGSG